MKRTASICVILCLVVWLSGCSWGGASSDWVKRNDQLREATRTLAVRNQERMDSLLRFNPDPLTSMRIDWRRMDEMVGYTEYFKKIMVEKVVHDLMIDPDSALNHHSGHEKETTLWLFGPDTARKRVDEYSAFELESKGHAFLVHVQSISPEVWSECIMSTDWAGAGDRSSAWATSRFAYRSLEESVYQSTRLIYDLEKLREALLFSFMEPDTGWLKGWKADLERTVSGDAEV